MHPISTPTRLPRWGPRRWLRCSSLKYSRLFPMIPDILGRRALSAGRLAALGATTNFGDATLVKASRLHDATLGSSQRMVDDERFGVEFFDDRLHLANLQPRHHAVQDVLLRAAHAAVALVHRHASSKTASDPVANRRILIRHHGDGGELVDAMEDEVERSGRRHVREDGVERRIDTQYRHRNLEQHDVEREDDVADLLKVGDVILAFNVVLFS